MKKVTTLALLGLLTLAMGQDVSVDQQIENIKNASAQDRVKLMNEFKQKWFQRISKNVHKLLVKCKSR